MGKGMFVLSIVLLIFVALAYLSMKNMLVLGFMSPEIMMGTMGLIALIYIFYNWSSLTSKPAPAH